MTQFISSGSTLLFLLLFFPTSKQVLSSTTTDRPEIIQLIAINPTTIRVDWCFHTSAATNDTVQYDIQYRKSNSSTSTFETITVATSVQLSYTINDLMAGMEYVVRIRANVSGSVSDASDEVTAQTPLEDNYCESGIDPDYHFLWSATTNGMISSQMCSGTNISMASRKCNNDGSWSDVDASGCQFISITLLQEEVNAIKQKFQNLTINNLDDAEGNYTVLINEIADILAGVDAGVSLYPTDLRTINVILQDALRVFNQSFVLTNNSNIDANLVMEVFNGMLSIDNLAGWTSLQQDNPGLDGELLLKNAENYALFLANSLDVSSMRKLTISKENLVLQVTTLSSEEVADLTFPTNEDIAQTTDGESAIHDAQITIPMELMLTRFGGNILLPIANIYFKNLEKFLALDESSGLMAGSRIISSQVGEVQGNNPSLVDKPVKLNFTIFMENFTTAQCAFWDFQEIDGRGSWSQEGLRTNVPNNSNHVVCESTHLTSFVVLVDISTNQNMSDVEPPIVLSGIVYIGLSISTVCLLITILFFLVLCKRTLSNIHFFIHLNLVISLLLAHVLFMAGVQFAVNIEDVCIAVTFFLHYFFLASMSWMMCEGIMLFLILLVDFSKLSNKWWIFLILGWVPSLILVSITIAIKHNEYGRGLGFCWLSTEDDIIWALVGPAAFFILVNVVFLFIALGKLMVIGCCSEGREQKKDKRVKLVKSVVKSSLVLLPLLGSTCAVSILLVNYNITPYLVVFTVLYSLQGLMVIFFYIICTDLVWSRICCKTTEDEKPKPRYEHSLYSRSREPAESEKEIISMKAVTQDIEEGVGNDNSHHDAISSYGEATTFKKAAARSTTENETNREKEKYTTTGTPVKKISVHIEEPSVVGKNPSSNRKAVQIQDALKRSNSMPKKILSHDELVTKFQTRYYDEDLSFTRTDPRSMKRSQTESDILPSLASRQGIFGSRGGVGLMKLRYDPEAKAYLMVSVANQKEKKRSFF